MTREEAIEYLDNIKQEEFGRGIGASEFYSRLIGYHVQALNIAIKALEQEPKTGRWIPVSERLPNKDRYTDFYKCLVAVSCTSRNTLCESFTAYFDGTHFYKNGYDKAIISGVKAWMPLPEPYKAESEDKE